MPQKTAEKMIKCKINGREILVPKGTTIIQAFKKRKADIAHYCWHPGLSAAGACRLCLVEIEGQNKLQIACNTEIQDGMVISNQSEKTREAVRWGLEFHLINHPLDCPICDQAGECSLQDQYMKFGAYSPSMSQAKVKKRKVVDLGSKIVLDTERCILCSRCVRFTDEVSKTHELGIFDRGDKSEIGIFKDKPLENNYALNTVDICPVGALTSKDFRFKQRVWYMKTADSLCTGCATGCAIHTDYNEEGLWRVRPRHNPEVNGYWMCDKGRGLYKYASPENRLRLAKRGKGSKWESARPLEALREIRRETGWGDIHASLDLDNHTGKGGALPELKKTAASLGEKGKKKDQKTSRETSAPAQKPLSGNASPLFVLTGQYTNEEYQALAAAFPDGPFYHWLNGLNKEGLNGEPNKKTLSADGFDGLLFRGGDRNPNTAGLKKHFPKIKPWKNFEDLAPDSRPLLILGPENQNFYPDLRERTAVFSQWKILIWMAVGENPFLPPKRGFWQIPLKSSFEKNGSFISAKGLTQKIKAVQTLAPQALYLQNCLQFFKEGSLEPQKQSHPYFKTNQFLEQKEDLWRSSL